MCGFRTQPNTDRPNDDHNMQCLFAARTTVIKLLDYYYKLDALARGRAVPLMAECADTKSYVLLGIECVCAYNLL